MAERVASLYAEIGGKTDGLKTALSEVKSSLTSTKSDLGELATASRASTRAIDTHFDNMADSITANLNSSKSAFDRFSSTVKSGATSASNFSSGTMKALSAAGKAWNDLATPLNQSLEILGKVGRAAQQAYQFISEGTQLATTAHQFDALSKSIGTTSDALLGELKTATRGTISDAQLMASATSIMSLGLADTSEETVRLASLVGKLGWDMNQVTLTLANQSTMRLDSLGLSVADVTGRVDALKASGMSADQAFKFAILEAGEEKVKLLGDSADTAAGKLKILESNVANAGDSFKMAFSENFIQNLNATALGLFEVQENASSLFSTLGAFTTNFSFMGFIRFAKEGIADLGDTGTSTGTKISGMGGVVNKALNAMAAGMSAGAKAAAAHDAAVLANIISIDDRSEAIKSHNQVLQDGMSINQANTQAVYESSDAYAELQERIGGSEYIESNAAAVQVANQRLKEWRETIPTVTGAVYASSEAIAAHTATTGDYATMAIQAQEQGLDLNQVMYDSLDAAGGSAEALVGLALATGQLTEAQAENILKQAAMIEFAKGLGEQIAAGTISINDAVTSLSNFEAGLESSNALINTATGSVILMDESLIGAGSSVGSLQTSLDTFTTANAVGATQAFLDKLNSIPRTVDVQVNVHGGEGVTAHGGYQNPDAGATSPPTGGGNIPHNARGTNFFPGGQTWVGEMGPEIVTLPRGSQIASAEQSQRMTGDTYNIYLTPANPDNVIQSIHYLQSLSRS